MNSLKNQLEKFKRMDPKLFEDNIKDYMKLQSVKELKSVLVNSFVSTNKRSTQALEEV